MENRNADSEVEEFFPETVSNGEHKVILECRNVRKYYGVKAKTILFSKTVGNVKAGDGVDLQLYQGEVL